MNVNPTAAAFIRRFSRPAPEALERCELCSAALGERHPHLLELALRRPVCACGACAILFGGGATGRFRRIPDRIEELTGFRLTDLQWQALGLPVNLAFFLRRGTEGRTVAVYPSPAGVTESTVSPDAWQDVVQDNPPLAEFEPDVEALLVNRVRPARENFRVGVDQCFRLAGLIRVDWRGFSGGSALWDEIGRFFAELRRLSRPAREARHA